MQLSYLLLGAAVVLIPTAVYGLDSREDRSAHHTRPTGGLQPRTPQQARVLLERRAQVSPLVAHWDHAFANSVAAMNLYLDEPDERRCAAIERIRREAGEDCRNEEPFVVMNALRGR